MQFYGCKDAATSEITVLGLNGTFTPSNPEKSLIGRSSSHGIGVRPFGAWDQAGGSLSVKLFKSVKAFDMIRFSVDLKNPNQPQVTCQHQLHSSLSFPPLI
jgi:hypothetical protein